MKSYYFIYLKLLFYYIISPNFEFSKFQHLNIRDFSISWWFW